MSYLHSNNVYYVYCNNRVSLTLLTRNRASGPRKYIIKNGYGYCFTHTYYYIGIRYTQYHI